MPRTLQKSLKVKVTLFRKLVLIMMILPQRRLPDTTKSGEDLKVMPPSQVDSLQWVSYSRGLLNSRQDVVL